MKSTSGLKNWRSQTAQAVTLIAGACLIWPGPLAAQ